jgi:hypothetical protein
LRAVVEADLGGDIAAALVVKSPPSVCVSTPDQELMLLASKPFAKMRSLGAAQV